MKHVHTNQDLTQLAQQFRTDKSLPPELSSANSLLVFLWALATIDWKLAATLFEEWLEEYPDLPPVWGGLLAHLTKLGPSNEAQLLIARNLPKLIQLHSRLAAKMDPQREGLISEKMSANGDYVISPFIQTSWIWSNQAIIELGANTELDILPLILINELSVFEVNNQLWIPENASFGQISIADNQLHPTLGFEGFLPMFAAIPDQETAESMYIELQALGLPLDQDTLYDIIPDIPLATVFMLYVGLLEYEMSTAAQSLKLRYLEIAKKDTQLLANLSVALLWENY